MSSDIRNESLVTPTDEESFEAVFTRYYPMAYQLAYRCTGQRDEADDIAQEVFLRFYCTPPHATGEVERRAWLCRVTTNLGVNYPMPEGQGLVSVLHLNSAYRSGRAALASSHDTSGRIDKTPVLIQSCRVSSVLSATFRAPTRSLCKVY